jgi:nitrite reductase/ring-hydroxylating ferredoxin subunit
MAWFDALPLDELAAKGKTVVRHEGRQILLLHTERGVFACANRCPHEGYPLSEGSLADGCVLTCNWHNWKFDLTSGATLVGGDQLPRYPVRLENGRVWLDVSPPDPELRRQAALRGIAKALEDGDQQRLVRETARLVRLGADPAEAVAIAVSWVAERLEFGTTHAIAGAPDWLHLSSQPGIGDIQRIAAVGEILCHIADDARAGRCFPLPQGEAPWNEAAFLAAIEDEDEPAACALLRGALATVGELTDLLPTLLKAALSHYADFGHALIYTVKTFSMAERLRRAAAEPLLLMLARSLVYATREDLLPEFRDYRARLAGWGEPCDACPALDAAALRRTPPKSAMALVAAWGSRHPPEAIFAVLVESAAWILLHVDERRLVDVEAKLADNIGWLDFTHMLTFAEAAVTAMRRVPALWPAVLLQLACFIGRNAGYVDAGLDARDYAVADIAAFIAERRNALFDHGRDRFIISVHLTKTLLAGATLMEILPAQAPLLAASLNRFLTAPMKGRHVLRTARQMWDLVEQD